MVLASAVTEWLAAQNSNHFASHLYEQARKPSSGSVCSLSCGFLCWSYAIFAKLKMSEINLQIRKNLNMKLSKNEYFFIATCGREIILAFHPFWIFPSYIRRASSYRTVTLVTEFSICTEQTLNILKLHNLEVLSSGLFVELMQNTMSRLLK